MRSPLDDGLGEETPRILFLPPDVHSLDAAQEAIELADAYLICDGNPLSESQKVTLRGALGERRDGSWAASRVGDFGPRQGTGKTDKIAARELAGLVLFDERLQIHTAHEFPTANEAFLRMVAIFENWDDLRKRVARILYGNGTQSINLLSGQRLLYKPRTGGAARGFAKADLVVYDEAQEVKSDHLSASAPAKLANPNSQSWYAGSGGLTSSAVAWEMRRKAVLGSGGRLAYTEWTAETFDVADGKVVWHQPVDHLDRGVWYEAMPGLGRWVTEESMLDLADELGAEKFIREGLCVWDPEPDTGGGWLVIGRDEWERCSDPLSGPLDPVMFGLDVSEARDWAAIMVAGRSGRGGVHLELTFDQAAGLSDYRPGTDWVVARAKAIHAKWRRPFAVVKGSPAWSLEPELTTAGVELVPLSREEFSQACGSFFDAVRQGGVRHHSQPALDTAVANLAKRSSGDAFVWDRRSAAFDICPAVAATVAMWACTQPDTTAEARFTDLNALLEDD